MQLLYPSFRRKKIVNAKAFMTRLKKPLCRFERIKIVNFKHDDFDIED